VRADIHKNARFGQGGLDDVDVSAARANHFRSAKLSKKARIFVHPRVHVHVLVHVHVHVHVLVHVHVHVLVLVHVLVQSDRRSKKRAQQPGARRIQPKRTPFVVMEIAKSCFPGCKFDMKRPNAAKCKVRRRSL